MIHTFYSGSLLCTEHYRPTLSTFFFYVIGIKKENRKKEKEKENGRKYLRYKVTDENLMGKLKGKIHLTRFSLQG